MVLKSIYIKYLIFCMILVPTTAYADTSDYIKAKADFSYLTKLEKPTENQFNIVASRLNQVYRKDPKGKLADDSLHYTVQTYYKKYQRFHNKQDIKNTLKYLKILASNYNTRLASLAYLQSAQIYLEHNDTPSAIYMLKKVMNRFPDSEDAITAKKKLNIINKDATAAAYDSQNATVGKIYFDEKTDKVVIPLSRHTIYLEGSLSAPRNKNNIDRYYVDIASITEKRGSIELENSSIKAIRWAENTPGTFRVVLDNLSSKTFKTSMLKNPDRIVIAIDKTEKRQQVSSHYEFPPESKKEYQGNESTNRSKKSPSLEVPKITFSSSKKIEMPEISDKTAGFLQEFLLDGLQSARNFLFGKKQTLDFFIEQSVEKMRNQNLFNTEFYMLGFINGLSIFVPAEKIADDNTDLSTLISKIMTDIAKREPDSIIVIHNVYSGNLIPSQNDMTILDILAYRLEQKNIKIYDYILTNRKGFFSLRMAKEQDIHSLTKYIN